MNKKESEEVEHIPDDVQPEIIESERGVSSPKEKRRVNGMLESLEMMAMQRISKDNIDISHFNSNQIDKLLDIMSKNEDNAFEFHKKRLETTEKVQCRAIDSTTVIQRNTRYIVLSIIVAISIMMLVILLLKEQYFITFLSFITGILGGVGLRGLLDKVPKKTVVPKFDNGENDDE